MVKDLVIQVEPLLVCDLKALLQLLGLYQTYHPSSNWKCPWCKVSDFEIADFTVEHWPFRNKAQWRYLVKRLRGKSLSTRKANAASNFGIQAEPVLDLPLTNIIPCMLHTVMALVKKLVQLVARDVRAASLKEAWVRVFTSLGITLAAPKKKAETFEERVKRSRLKYPECLRVLTHFDRFLNEFPKTTAMWRSRVEMTEKVMRPILLTSN